jgi:hypothetical protein
MNSDSLSTPWYESNLLWGSVGTILTVIASSKHDLRWLFLLAWPCLSVVAWRLANRTRWVWPVAVVGVTLIGAGLLGLSIWLKPVGSNRPPSLVPASPKPDEVVQRPTPPPSTARNRLKHPQSKPGVSQSGTGNNQTAIQGGVIQQNSTGDCSPNIVGSGNTNNCNLPSQGNLKDRAITLSQEITQRLYEDGWTGGQLQAGVAVIFPQPGANAPPGAWLDWMDHACRIFRFFYAPRVIAIHEEFASLHRHDRALDQFVADYQRTSAEVSADPRIPQRAIPPFNMTEINGIAESLQKLANQL